MPILTRKKQNVSTVNVYNKKKTAFVDSIPELKNNNTVDWQVCYIPEYDTDSRNFFEKMRSELLKVIFS